MAVHTATRPTIPPAPAPGSWRGTPSRGRGATRSRPRRGQLAYSLFLAIPSALLVVLGVFSLVASPADVSGLIQRVRTVIPAEVAALLEDSLRRSVESPNSGVTMTIVGAVLALWATTSAAATLMEGLATAFERPDNRGFARKRGWWLSSSSRASSERRCSSARCSCSAHRCNGGSVTPSAIRRHGLVCGGRRSGPSSSAAFSSPSRSCSTSLPTWSTEAGRWSRRGPSARW